ncbi:MAG TPA: WYL domain-containing protein [Steroidobacteraceae bacterium]|jgi:predicted DNA-binding transcriptional regulator YafY
MRADRLLSILMTLQLRGRVTADALAAQLEVSQRTIYRDVEALSRCGVPIVTERGRSGGLALIDGYRTELTGLSGQEAEALPFAGLGDAAAALGLAASAEAARLKVFAALPQSGRERAHRASECFYLDPVDWYRHATTPQFLRLVAAAAWASQSIEIDYESWRARKKRIIDPLGLVLKAGRWYLVARSKRNTSIFRLESIHAVRSLPKHFVRPKRFNLANLWRGEVSRFETSLRRMKATIRIAPAAISRIDRLGADAAESIHHASPDERGWREASIWMESINHAASLLLGFSTDIEVVAPEELRVELTQRAARVCALYE